jgi:hypothetical protein
LNLTNSVRDKVAGIALCAGNLIQACRTVWNGTIDYWKALARSIEKSALAHAQPVNKVEAFPTSITRRVIGTLRAVCATSLADTLSSIQIGAFTADDFLFARAIAIIAELASAAAVGVQNHVRILAS